VADYLVQLAERRGRGRRWSDTVTAQTPQDAIAIAIARTFGAGARLVAGRVQTQARRCPVELQTIQNFATGPVTVDVFEQGRLFGE
jgi:hypothetical protein